MQNNCSCDEIANEKSTISSSCHWTGTKHLEGCKLYEEKETEDNK